MKLKKITAVLVSAAVTLGCAQIYAAEVPLTEYDTVSDTGGTDNGGGEMTEPSETPAEETWTANPVYNEETGFLTWDEYPGAKDAKFVTYSAVINDGEGDTYTMYLPDRAACLPFYVAKQSQDGEEGEPWTINGDCEVRVVADPYYEDESTDDNNVITSSDYFCYTFNGGTINPDLPIPVVTEGTLGSPYEQSDGITAVPVHAVFQEGTYENIGVLYKLTYNGTETIDCDYGIYRTCPEGQDHYCCHTNITYGESGEVYVQACSVGIDGSQSEWSEPYLLTAPAEPEEPDPDIPEGTWNANFVYNEETGILSWDDIINSDEEFFYGIYIISSHATGRIHGNSSGAGGWGDSRLDVPNINLPLCLASLSYDSDFTGEIHVSVTICPADNDEFVYYKSADSGVVFTYDGRDVNTEIEVPSLKVYGGKVKWNLTEGAIGYLYSKDGEKPFGFSSMPADVNEFTLTDDVSSLAVCSVDKNGDVSEWSELVTASEEAEQPKKWEANFTYNEETGFLSFDGCKEAEEAATQSLLYTLKLYNKDLYSYSPDTINVYSFQQSDGSFSTPSVSLPAVLATSGLEKGSYEIRAWVNNIYWSSSNQYKYYSEDGFAYEFKGGDVDPKLAAPDVGRAVVVVTNGVIFDDNRGTSHTRLVYRFDNIPEKARALLKELTLDGQSPIVYIDATGNLSSSMYGAMNIFTELPDSQKISVRVCAVDINGNRSEWSKPVDFELKENKIEKDGYYHFNYAEESVGMSIAADQYNNNTLGAAYRFDMYIPGVQLGKITVGELKEICKGIKINDYEFAGCSVPGLTAEDFFTSVVVQTDKDGAMYDGWNDTYDTLSFDFDTDIREKDSEIVRNFIFHIGIRGDAIKKAGLKDGDYLTVYLGKPAEVNGNTFTYVDNNDGITITGGTINNPDVAIPAEIDGKTVTEIGMNAFAFNNNIETLTIPENVKRIDWYAFNTCEKLTEVTLPESLEYIDNWAFERCFSLKTVNIPKNTAHVGSGAFAQNTSMTSINCDTANGAYISVDGVLFTKDMKELTAYPCGRSGGYTVPESVNHIGNAAFYGAKKLSSVEISGTLDFIGFEAFAECELLSSVNINDGVNYVGYWAFRGCTGIKQLTVPQSVTNIGDQAFGFRYADNKYDDFSLRGYKDSAIYYYAIRHDIPFVIIGDADNENSPFKEENVVEEPVASDPSKAEEDSITSITVNPAFNMKNKNETGVGIDLTKIKIKAEEIYQDEESIRRAEEALGDAIKGNKHYNLLDLTLLYDGEDFSNGYDGLVKVIIPIPAGHRDKEFYCYRIVDNNGTPEKELIPGKRVEDSYIIYLEHFSTYAFVGDGDHEHSFSKSYESDDTNHWHECSCGEISEAAAHTASEPITENGVKYTECTVCGRILSKENVSDTETPDTPSKPTTESGSGTFVLPDTTTESATAEASALSSETTVSQASADNTDTSSDDTAQGSISDNNTDDNGGGNTGSADNTGNATANEDKNQNTGVTLAIFPILAAAVGIIFSKKRK